MRPSARRKTLSVSLYPGEVRVAYPRSISQKTLHAWLAQKQAWILKHYTEADKRERDSLALGADIFWQGQRHTLADNILAELQLPEHFFELSAEQKQSIWLTHCQQYCEVNFPPRIQQLEQHMQLFSQAVKLRPYKSCWGSCNHRGLVALNTLLAMAPQWVVDYVIVHELSHLQHPNHSSSFWRLVEAYQPAGNVQSSRRWLKTHGHTLLNVYR